MLFNFIVLSLCAQSEANSVDIKSLIDKGKLISAAKAVITILLSDGDTLSEINSISDAIVHCRGGSGIALPNGNGLTAEMKSDKTYKKYVGSDESVVAQIIKKKLTKLPWTETKGTLNLNFRSDTVLSCFTLGHYVPTVSGAVEYEFMSLSGTQRACIFKAKIKLAGTDPWDFNDNQCYSKLKNLILERIPNFLVSLRGNMKEFDINYSVSEEIVGTFKQNK